MHDAHWTPIDPADQSLTYAPTAREHVVMAAYGVGRAIRSTIRNTRRALLTYRPTYVPLAVAVLVVTPTAAALATWATLPSTGGALHMPPVLRVEAASEPSGDAGTLGEPFGGAEQMPNPTPTADPRLQPGYVDPVAPAAPDTAVTIAWLPEGVRRWSPLLSEAASEHGVAADLLAIIVLVESGGHPSARSHAGATGLMQVMPATAGDIARQRGLGEIDPSTLNDPAVCVDFGAWYIAKQLQTFGAAEDPDWQTSVERAAAAYNGGPGTAQRWLRGGALPSETARYVEWVGGMWRERRDPTSPTYERWLAAGGAVLVDKADRDGGAAPAPAAPTPAYVPPVAPGGPTHLEARTP